MSNNLKTILIGLAFFLFTAVVVFFYGDHKGYVRGKDKGYAVGYENGYAAGFDAPHPSDTVWRDTTIYKPYPVPTSVVPDGYELAPAGTLADLRAQLDSLSNAPDTVTMFVPVPIERKTYSDDDYTAVVSGYKPVLESIEVFQKTAIVTKYVEKKMPYAQTVSLFVEGDLTRFQMSARAGIVYDGRVYGSLRGYVSAGYEYGTVFRGPFAKGGIKLDVFNK